MPAIRGGTFPILLPDGIARALFVALGIQSGAKLRFKRILETFSADENIFKANSAFASFVPIQAAAAVVTVGTAQIAFKLTI